MMEDQCTLIKNKELQHLREEIARLKAVKEPELKIYIDAAYTSYGQIKGDITLEHGLEKQIKRLTGLVIDKIRQNFNEIADTKQVSPSRITTNRRLQRKLEWYYLIPKTTLRQ